MDAVGIPGAVCAVHPDQPYTFACARCGAFACEVCRAQSDAGLCGACAARQGGRELTVEEVVSAGFALPFAHLRRLLPFAGLYLVPAIASSLYNAMVVRPRSQEALRELGHADLGAILGVYGHLLGPLLVPTVVGFLFSTLAFACEVQVFADALEGRARPAREQLRAALRALPASLGVNFVRDAGGLLLLFCCVPGVWFAAMLSLAAPAAALGADSSRAFGGSWALVKPRFWMILGVQAIGWLVAVGGAVCTGGASVALRLAGTPGQVAAGVLAGTVAALFPLPLCAMNTYCYLRLRGGGRGSP